MTSTLETTTSTLWPQSPMPETRGTPWQWQVTTVRQLSGLRGDLRTRLRSVGCDDASCGDPISDRILLAFDELASNALRHGGQPVHARVMPTADGWLIDISDAATALGPRPASGRDPAQGGMGLPLVAELSTRHGWVVRAGRKHVWAALPSLTVHTAPESPTRHAVGGVTRPPATWATLIQMLAPQGRALANARRAVDRDRRAAAHREEADRAFTDAAGITMEHSGQTTGTRRDTPHSGAVRRLVE